MRIYTAHLRDNAEPVLIREGFSLGAMEFGPLWLLLNRAWIPAALSFAAYSGVVLAGQSGGIAMLLALAWAHGLFGRDLVRWSYGLRGYRLEHVLAARDPDGALARLLAARPDLVADRLR